MAILIGTDEAGYGPNLGPLVIGASAWEVPDELREDDLYDRLESCICRLPAGKNDRIAIADSKLLYKPRGTLAGLEAGVHVVLANLQRNAHSWREAFALLDTTPTMSAAMLASPWYCEYDEMLPLDLSRKVHSELADRLSSELRECATSVAQLRTAVVFPAEFNGRVRQLGSKGALLTERTLELVRDVLAECPAGDAMVFCDKHGGRNRYAAALQHTFPDSWVEILHEGRASSEYRLTVDNREVRFRFAVGGESQLPSALASMPAKYIRAPAIRAFNAFWQKEVPNLRPTAGYPTDAKRFKADVAAVQASLKIDDDTLWRCK